MPIDTTVPLSDGWWLARLSGKLERRRPRLDLLDDYYRGDPPLPEGAANPLRAAYRDFQRRARTNFAELVVEAARERMIPVGFRTAGSDDENGDAEAWRLWRANGLIVESADLLRTMLSLGDAYAIVGSGDNAGDPPVITAEDPRQVVTEHDPRRQRTIIAAAKLFYDDVQGADLAYLYLPGRLLVARRASPGARRRHAEAVARDRRVPQTVPRFGGQAWDWDGDLSGPLPDGMMPVVRFRNRRGWGEYEHHLDLLDRINHTVLQRLVITAIQAYKQRAIKGTLPKVDNQGNVIDYNALFTADPGALWELPDGVDLWESAQADLTPVLSAARDDIQNLAAVTRTPLHYMQPGGDNQSAEGAALSREGLVFKAEDRIARASDGLTQMMSLAFRLMGDKVRADPLGIEPMWAPPDRSSLAERYDAAVKAQAAGVPRQTIWSDVLGFSPDQVARMESEAADQALAAELVAQQAGPAAAAPPGSPPAPAAPPTSRPGAGNGAAPPVAAGGG